MALCILCSGNPVITSGMLSNTCNSYKIRSESIEIADTILALNDYEPTSLLVFSPDRKTWEKYEVGGTVYEGIKQYTGLIDIAGYGYTESQWNDCMLSEMTPNGWLSSYDYTRIILNEYFENHKSYQYILMPDDDKIIAKMDYCGFELVAHIDSYYLFENKIS